MRCRSGGWVWAANLRGAHIAAVGLTTGFRVRYLAPGSQKQSVRIRPLPCPDGGWTTL